MSRGPHGSDMICAAAVVDTSRHHMAVRSACEKVNLELKRERAIKQAEEAEKQQLAMYNAMAQQQNMNAPKYMLDVPFGCEVLGSAGKGLAYTPTPCQYCGRTNQKHGHTSCDGCGAPR